MAPAFGGVEAQYGAVSVKTELPSTGIATVREHQETRALLPAYTDEANGGLFGPGARRTDNNRTMTVILILNYMIGSGILNTAQTFRNSGAAASCVLFIISGESLIRS